MDTQPDSVSLDRRNILYLFGSSIVALGVLGCGSDGESASMTSPTSPTQGPPTVTTCVVRPQQIEGPYFVDERLNRSDLRADPTTGAVKEGVPLALAVKLSQQSSGACTPLSGAMVDIWHCDALGVYSDVRDPNFTTIGQKFLRGYQTTDSNGLAQFTTIFPGWYLGRAVHIHFKIRTAVTGGRAQEFTSQLYFDEALIDAVHARAPYSARGRRSTMNAADGIFQGGGSQLLVQLLPQGEGYSGTFDIAVQM